MRLGALIPAIARKGRCPLKMIDRLLIKPLLGSDNAEMDEHASLGVRVTAVFEQGHCLLKVIGCLSVTAPSPFDHTQPVKRACFADVVTDAARSVARLNVDGRRLGEVTACL